MYANCGKVWYHFSYLFYNLYPILYSQNYVFDFRVSPYITIQVSVFIFNLKIVAIFFLKTIHPIFVPINSFFLQQNTHYQDLFNKNV